LLAVERAAIDESVRSARSAGVEADYSLASIVPFLIWITERVETHEVSPTPDSPEWLAESIRPEDLVEVGESSRPLVLRAAYYLGESFARNRPHLRWGVGSSDFAHQQQPAVLGFGGGVELPVLLVAENTLLNAIQAEEPRAAIEPVIDTSIARA
jgi:hypothetical protein